MAQNDEATTVALVDRILTRAINEGASDIHIEPRRQRVQVRFRIDGSLVERPAFPLEYRSSVVSRLKVLATLDIAERRLPQDGAFRMTVGRRNVDLRISCFPTQYGEKVVLRCLFESADELSLERLGMTPDLCARLRRLSQRPHGIILVAGPTGSGKTSTLYGLLNDIDGRNRNIVTLEDPIEYRFSHVSQTQIQPKIGFNFSSGLRALLRQDPDVMMVGEMRDAETADIAFKAALTGHLVLSSIHTNSAIETFVRIFDMGLERYVVASALEGLLAQRLVRRLCARCAQPKPVSKSDLAIFDETLQPPDQVMVPVGCEACHGIGYHGRTGIFELIEVDDELMDLMKSETNDRRELSAYLRKHKHYGLRVAGLNLVKNGITSLQEVLRVA